MKSCNIIPIESTNIAHNMETDPLELRNSNSSTAGSDKIYKVVSINNKIVLVEHNDGDLNLNNEGTENHLDPQTVDKDKENKKVTLKNDNASDSILDNFLDVNNSLKHEVNGEAGQIQDDNEYDIEYLEDFEDEEYGEVNQTQDENDVLKAETDKVANCIGDNLVDANRQQNIEYQDIQNSNQDIQPLGKTREKKYLQVEPLRYVTHNQNKPLLTYSRKSDPQIVKEKENKEVTSKNDNASYSILDNFVDVNNSPYQVNGEADQIQNNDEYEVEYLEDLEGEENGEVNQTPDSNDVLNVETDKAANRKDNSLVNKNQQQNIEQQVIINKYLDLNKKNLQNSKQDPLGNTREQKYLQVEPLRYVTHNQNKPLQTYSRKPGAGTELRVIPLDKLIKTTKHLSRPKKVIEKFVNYVEAIMNYKGCDDHDILIYGKKGTAIALIRENKYKLILERLNELKKVKQNLQKCQIELKQAKIDKEECVNNAKNDTLRHQEELRIVNNLRAELTKDNSLLKYENKKLNNEIIELKALKENITKVFSEAQIGLLTHQNKSTYSWSDEDMKKAAFLTHITSSKAYLFLKTQMKFPLPTKNAIKKWMIERNIYIKPKRKKDESTEDANEFTTQLLNVNESNIQIQPTDPADNAMDTSELNPSVEYSEENNIQMDANECTTIFENVAVVQMHGNKSKHSLKAIIVENTNREETETQQAVELIVEQPQMEHIDNFINSHQEQAGVVGSDGDIFYLDDNNVMGDYVITENYIDGEGNTQNVTDAHDDINAGSVAHGGNDNNENMANREDDTSGGNDVHGEIVPNIEDVPDDIDVNMLNSYFSKWDLNVIENYRQNKRICVVSRKMNWLLMCQLCMKLFETEDLLKQHVPVHYFNTYCTTYLDAQKPYQCEFCHEMVKQKTTLVRHHLVHLGITSYNCWYPGCSYVAKSKECLTSHMTRHYPPRHACPQCGGCFKSRTALRSHYKRRHSVSHKPRRCRLCHCVCRNAFTYMLHMRAHTRPPRHKCPVEGCTEAFYSRLALGKHKLTHTEDVRPYKCPHCPLATYSHEFLLKRHLEKHEKYKIAHCMRCKLIFDTYSEYYTHVKKNMHTRKLAKYKCACNQGFTSKKKLRLHEAECKVAVACAKVKKRRIIEKENINKTNIKTMGRQSIKPNEFVKELSHSLDNNSFQITFGMKSPAEPNAGEVTIQPGYALKTYQRKTKSDETPLKRYTLMKLNEYLGDDHKQNTNKAKDNSKTNIISDQLVQYDSMNITDDSHSASVQMLDSNHDSEQQQIYVQNEIELPYAGQPDVSSTDQDGDQQDIPSLHPVQETQHKAAVDGSLLASGSLTDVLGLLMKQNGCLREAGIVEESSLTSASTCQENSVMKENMNQPKISTDSIATTVGQEINQSEFAKSLNLNVTPASASGNINNNLIQKQNVVLTLAKVYKQKVITQTKVKIVPKIPKALLKNVLGDVGNSSKDDLKLQCKQNQTSIKNIRVSNQSLTKNVDHPAMSVQISKDIGETTGQDYQQNKVTSTPMATLQSDMPPIDLPEHRIVQKDVESPYQVQETQHEAAVNGSVNSKTDVIGLLLEQNDCLREAGIVEEDSLTPGSTRQENSLMKDNISTDSIDTTVGQVINQSECPKLPNLNVTPASASGNINNNLVPQQKVILTLAKAYKQKVITQSCVNIPPKMPKILSLKNVVGDVGNSSKDDLKLQCKQNQTSIKKITRVSNQSITKYVDHPAMSVQISKGVGETIGQDYQQNKVTSTPMATPQSDMPLFDQPEHRIVQKDVGSPHQVQETQHKAAVDSSVRSKTDVIGLLIKHNDCLQEAGIVEENSLSSSSRQESSVMKEDMNQPKIATDSIATTVGQEINQSEFLKPLNLNVTSASASGNINNNLISRPKVILTLAKAPKRKVITQSCVNIPLKMPKILSLKNVVSDVGNSSKDDLKLQCKQKQTSIKKIIRVSNQSLTKNVDHPAMLVQISKDVGEMTGQGYQQNKVILPKQQPDMPSLI